MLHKSYEQALVNGINVAIENGSLVILTINTDHFLGNSDESSFPDHFIQIIDVVDNGDGTISVNYWSWGEEYTEVMSEDEFYDSTYFYGSFK